MRVTAMMETTVDQIEAELAVIRETITLSRGETRARLRRIERARLAELHHRREHGR